MTRFGQGASSDELNNKRCKYDNFSQDVASNNKIKIILKVSKVTVPKSQRRSWRRRGCERQPGRGSPGVAQDSQWQQHCGWSVVCAVCGAQENIQFVASFLFRLLSSCSACLLWLPSSCSPCLPLVLAYVKEQLRRLLLPFVPCQFNWFVFYAKEDYTSSWRRL